MRSRPRLPRSSCGATRPAPFAASRRRSPSTSTTSSSARAPGGGPLMPTVRIPPTLRTATGGAREVEATGDTVRDLLDDLGERFPTLRGQVLDGGELAPFVNVYVEGEDVRTLDGLETEVADGVDRDPAAGDGRRPARRPRAVAPRAGRPHAARRARPPLAAGRLDLREARGPEPDRFDQGPRREGDDRGRRGLRRAPARPRAARADER